MSFFTNLTDLANDLIVRLSPIDEKYNDIPVAEVSTDILQQPENSQQNQNVGSAHRRKWKSIKGEIRRGRHLKKMCEFCGVPFYTSYLSRHMAKFCPVGETKSPIERRMARRRAKVITSAFAI